MTVQELEQYRPIRGGGVILAAIILLPPLFYVITRTMLMSVATAETPRPIVEVLPLLSAFVSLVAGVLTHMRVDERHSPIEWIVHYWKCNVVGYSVVVHRCEGGRLDLHLGYRRTEGLHRFGFEYCQICHPWLFFVLRLGGWRSRWGMIVEKFAFYRPNGWEVRLLPRRFGDEKLWIELRVWSEQMRLSVDDALRLLSSLKEYHPKLGGQVGLLLRREAVATYRCGQAFAVIDGAIAQIAGTHRLKCSIDGKNLRQWLEAERGRLLKDDCSGIPEQARATAAASS